MSSVTQLIPLVTSSIPHATPKATLDCGCGFGKWASIIRCQNTGMKYAYIVGFDIFLPNLKYCKKYGAYDDLVLADAKKLPFRDDCFGLILACEMIEHMEKEHGETFLDELEGICFGRVIVTTPNMDFHNPIEYENQQKNMWEFHRSKWATKDFRKRGYVVRGIGVRWLLPTHQALANIVAAFDFLLFPSWFLPQMAKFLLAFKDKPTKT